MATYIPGLTDYIPQIQEFKPDYNFYNKALQMRQSKYDAAHEQLSTLYGSLLNSPMLRDKNVAERDQFFKVIDQDIKKMASLDLSKQQNVQAASSIFNQLLDNKSIVKDMSWTRNWQKQHQKADAMRNCVDPEKCGGSWWQGGVDYLNYQAEDFKNATDDEAMGFGSARYVAAQNITDMAMKIAKDANFNIKIDEKKGGYIVTTKNGLNAVQPLYTLLSGKIGNDPKVLDYLQAKNYVNRKNWVASNIPVYGSEEAATSEYVKQRSLELKDTLKKHQIDIDFTNDNIKKEIENLGEKTSDGLPVTKKDLQDIYNDILGTQNSIEETSRFIKDANDNYKQAEVNNFSKATLRSLDRAGILSDLEKELGTAAQTLAFKDFEQTIRVDEYSLESFKQANRKALEIDKYYLNVGLEREKFQLDMLKKQYEAKGTLLENQAITVSPQEGGLAVNLGDDAGWNYVTEETNKTEEALSAAELSLVNDFFNITSNQAKNKGGLANEDLISFMDAAVGAFQNPVNYKNESTIPSSLKEQFRNYKSWTKEQKLAAAKNFDPANLGLLRGSVIDDIYDNNVAPLMDMSNSKNRISRDYLQDINKKREEEKLYIDVKDAYLNNLTKLNIKAADQAKDKIKISNPEFAPYIDLFIDKTGVPLSKEKFASNYMKEYLNNLRRQNKDAQISTAVGKDKYLEGLEIYDDYSEDVEETYKVLYNESIEKSPGTLKGFGSYEVDGADLFPVVDPALHLSTATQDVNSHINAYRKANSSDYRVSLGNFESTLPEESSADAKELLDFIITNFQRRANSKDKTRPIFTTTYQNIAGGNKNWDGINIKVNPEFIDQYKGSENLPGLTRSEYMSLVTDGITLYTNKENVKSELSRKSGKTDLEKYFEVSEEGYPITVVPQYAKNLKLERKGKDYYQVTGQMAAADGETGELVWQDVPYTITANDPNLLYKSIIKDMKTLESVNNSVLKDYMKRKGINSEQ